jgi:signal transduction histidine kinase
MSHAIAITRPVVRRSLQVAAVVLLGLLVAASVLQVLRLREAVTNERGQQLVRLAAAFADELTQAVLAGDIGLQATVDQVESRSSDSGMLAAAMRRRLRGVRQVMDMTVADAAGSVLADTRFDAAPALPEPGRELLRQFAATRTDEALVSTPFRLADGRWAALLARRVRGAGDSPGGMVAAWLDLATFEGFLRATDLNDGGVVRLLRRDGVVLARLPHSDAAVGTQENEPGLLRELPVRGTTAFILAEADGEGGRRLAALRDLRAYPLVIDLSAGDGALMASWSAAAVTFTLAASMAAVVVGALMLVLGQKAGDVDRLVAGYRVAKEAAEAANAQLRAEMEERARAETTLRHAQRIEVMGQLTGAVAHDFNNLLTVLLGNLDLLEMDKTLPPRVADRIAAMRGAAERGEMLTGQLLAFSRRQKLRPEPVELGALVGGLADLMQSAVGSRVRMEIENGKDLPPALVDPHQLELVLMNLVINARDAMPDGGTLTVTTATARLGPPASDDDPPAGDYVVLRVRDTGTGMTPDVQARALEPFFSTKGAGGGSGLGLSQVYGVARQSGGGVRIDSAPGRGSTVWVYLPVADTKPETAARPAPAPAATEGIRVLLVDDDQAVRTTTALILRDLGFLVDEAPDGTTALSLLAGDADVDVLVTDIAMPGIAGAELAGRAAELRPALPVVFLSGHADPAIAAHSTGAPRRLVRKPFRPSELAAEIAGVLRPAR